MKDKSTERSSKFKEFMEKRGFYIVLLLCAVAIAAASYFALQQTEPIEAGVTDSTWEYATFDFSDDPEPVTSPVTLPTQDVMAPETTSMDSSYAADTTLPEESATTAATQPAGGDDDDEPASPVGAISDSALFVMPVDGTIIKSYSAGELVFSQSMQDWRVHSGIDIAGSVGTKVKATYDGVVDDIYFDELMGWTVVLDHGDNMYSVYAGLSEAVVVEQGQQVEMGETIAGIGLSAISESVEGPHVHFELIKDGRQIDPMSRVKKH